MRPPQTGVPMGTRSSGAVTTRARGLADRVGVTPYLRRAKHALRGAPHETWSGRSAREDEDGMRLLLSFVLARDSTCVDVGAGLGDVLDLMVRYAPQGRHIAFEPIPEQCARVRARFPDLDVREAAASDGEGETTFTVAVNYPAYSGFLPRDYPAETPLRTLSVRTERIDDIDWSGHPPTLIKIDVEGAERLVLEGARRTILDHRPIVVFEHGAGSARNYGTTADQIHDLLCRDAGLRIFDLVGGGPYDRAAFASAKRWNFVAHR